MNDERYFLIIGKGQNSVRLSKLNQYFGPRIFRVLDLQWRDAAAAKR